MHGFTARQIEITQFIQSEIALSGEPPTIREIASRFRIRSISAVWEHLVRIEKKLGIRRKYYAHRGIEVLGASLAPQATT